MRLLVALSVLVGLTAGGLYAVATAPVAPAGPTRKPPVHARCTHGESSVYAWVDKHGRTHVSEPITTGCAGPRR
jgi:hypothetical protein